MFGSPGAPKLLIIPNFSPVVRGIGNRFGLCEIVRDSLATNHEPEATQLTTRESVTQPHGLVQS